MEFLGCSSLAVGYQQVPLSERDTPLGERRLLIVKFLIALALNELAISISWPLKLGGRAIQFWLSDLLTVVLRQPQ